MASKLSDRWQTQALSVFAVREILDKPLEDESAQSRIKQIGMINILYMMHQAHEKLTLSNIIQFTGMTRSGVIETIDILVKRGILTSLSARILKGEELRDSSSFRRVCSTISAPRDRANER